MIKGKACAGNVTLTLTMSRDSAARLNAALGDAKHNISDENDREDLIYIIDIITSALYG